MTLIIRHNPKMPSAPKKTSGKKKLSKKERFADLYANGSIEILRPELNICVLRFHGSLAKLPSTTNHRMITVPRFHILKFISAMIASPALRNIGGLKQLYGMVQKLRGFLTKNEEQQVRLEVMTKKYQEHECSNFKFDLNKESRALVLFMLGPDLNRSDSHNIPKAVCDWMEEIGMITNDRYVDTFAIRKTFSAQGKSSDIYIRLYDLDTTRRITNLFLPFFNVIVDKEIYDGERKEGGVSETNHGPEERNYPPN